MANLLLAINRHLVQPIMSPLRPGTVVMFHMGRNGSTVLGDLLDQHTRIFWDAEIYNRARHRWLDRRHSETERFDLDPIAYLRRRMRLAGYRYYGFEVKFHHLKFLHVDLPTFIASLDELDVMHWIVLRRANTLRKIISSQLARKLGQWHFKAEEACPPVRIKIDVQRVEQGQTVAPLIEHLDYFERKFSTLTAQLSGRKVLELVYEADIALDPLLAYQKVSAFLGLNPEQPKVRYKKNRDDLQLSELVENSHEINKALTGTPYEWMLSG